MFLEKEISKNMSKDNCDDAKSRYQDAYNEQLNKAYKAYNEKPYEGDAYKIDLYYKI